ncbi:MAG: LytTR family DNA-binding domain-containing protein [Bacteroidales bacterium]|jgi:DNA-binding LytR/AlgR family response regulator|nr:LytTR family DNA-binding domain-containing protein [Bacteroidales bacterium]
MRIAIIEDEMPAVRLLKNMIKKIRPAWEVCHAGGSVEEARAWYAEQEEKPTLLFLDIELSDGNSFEFLEKVKPKGMVVFVTAYDEYAVRAFSVNSIDYILKPLDIDRLRDCIEKFERNSSALFNYMSKENDWKGIAEFIVNKEKKYRTRFLISRGQQLETLHVEDIAYFFSENKICYAQTYKDGNFILDFSLDKLCEELDPDQFFRATRQMLVCPKAITKIENYFQGKVAVFLSPPYKEQVLVSKEKAESFRKWLNY